MNSNEQDFSISDMERLKTERAQEGAEEKAVRAPDGHSVPAIKVAPQEFFSRHAPEGDAEAVQLRRLLRILQRRWGYIFFMGFLFAGCVVAYDLLLRQSFMPAFLQRLAPVEEYESSVEIAQVQKFSEIKLTMGSLTSSAGTVDMSNLNLVIRGQDFRTEVKSVLQKMIRGRWNLLPVPDTTDGEWEARWAKMDPTMRQMLQAYAQGKNEDRIRFSATAMTERNSRLVANGPEPAMLPRLLEALTVALNEYGKNRRIRGVESNLLQLRSNQKALSQQINDAVESFEKASQELDERQGGKSEVLYGGHALMARLKGDLTQYRLEAYKLAQEIERLEEGEAYRRAKRRLGIETPEDIEKALIEGNPLRQKWLQLEQHYNELRVHLRAKHPEVQALEAGIAGIKERLRETGNVTSAGRVPPLPTHKELELLLLANALRDKLRTNSESIQFIEEQVRGEESRQQRLVEAARVDPEINKLRLSMSNVEAKLNRLNQDALSLTKQISDLELARGQLEQLKEFDMVSRQPTPPHHVKPAYKVDIALGLFLGLLLGYGIAYLIESTDNKLHTPADVYFHLRLNYLGVVPLWGARENVFISPERPDSQIANVYAHLCNNIRYGREGNPEKRLLVVSALQGEGKSVSATNMAIYYAIEGNNVLLIDADMRRPRIHRLEALGGTMATEPGLSDVLAGQATLRDVCRGTPIPGLSVVAAGTRVRNPAKLLASPATRAFLDEANKVFDIVVIDCPAVLPVVDATILAPHMRGVLMVIAADDVEIAAVRMAIYRLQHVGGPLLGALLNKVSERSAIYHTYGYRYRSGYSYSPYTNAYDQSEEGGG